jgi:hypothetical protein
MLTNLCLSSSASLSACSRANRLRSASAAFASSSVVIRIFAIIDAEIMKNYEHKKECLKLMMYKKAYIIKFVPCHHGIIQHTPELRTEKMTSRYEGQM